MTKTFPETIKKWQKLSWKIAEKHGWHEKEPLFDIHGNILFFHVATKLALIHSEVSEALDEVRNNKISVYYKDDNPKKPEGFEIELADIIIRVLDVAESMHIDIQKCLELKSAYNKNRKYRHGGKKF